jgi:hypothetical protein
MIQFKKIAFASVALALTGMFAAVAPAYAQTVGAVTAIYADPPNNVAPMGDYFIIELSVDGKCGSKWFHISRAASNQKEVAAMAMTALAADKRLGVYVTACSGKRNIISHGVLIQ